MTYHRKHQELTQSLLTGGTSETWWHKALFATEPLGVGVLPFGKSASIVGEGHPWTYKSTKKRFRDIGGNATVAKREFECYPVYIDSAARTPDYNGVYGKYRGLLHMYESAGIPNFPVVPAVLSDGTLTAKGATAWNQTKPTRSHGSLAQALGEAHQVPTVPGVKALKDALAQAPKGISLRKLLKSAGSEFLNIGFGWAPVISDLSDFIVNTINLAERIAQLERDNGRPVRRSMKLSGDEVQTHTQSATAKGVGCFPSIDSSFFTRTGDYHVNTLEKWDYRFTARFRYYIDFAKARNDDLGEMRKLLRMTYGLDFSVSTLYELMPWSWLLDWVTNVGDNIDNLVNDAADNLVADYAYINGFYTNYRLLTLNHYLKDSTGGNEVNARMQFSDKTTVFKRIKASPYGFGLNFSDFSPKRLAILAALGLNKLL